MTNDTGSTLYCNDELVLPEKITKDFVLSIGSASYFTIPISAVAIIGNGFVIAAIKKDKSLKSKQNLLIAFLAFADLLTGIVSMPLQEAYDIYLIKQGYVPCNLSLAAVITNSLLAAMSAVTIALMSCDRFLAFCYVTKYRAWSLKGLYTIIYIASWLFSIVFIVLFILVPHSNVLRMIGTIFISLVLCLICLLNIILFMSLKVNIRIMSRVMIQDAVNKRRRLLRQSAITLVVIVLVFILCFLPRAVFLAVASSKNHKAHLWTLNVLYLNSALNPLIYGFRSRAIFDAIAKILRLCKLR
ncbi:somatostatin receptor type 5-like [Rhopilema esculentum]|uniref:somatostatin receptor type 5-like n=1 Tax=Rhopilema esculentum TaxID=499914 RepID=UPI0031DBA74A|eukprot:gene6746-12310_t